MTQDRTGALCHVTTARATDYPDPIILREGDVVEVGQTDTTWPSFVWCTTSAGASGWVPDAYLQREGSRARARRDYEATELTICGGEELAIEDEIGGWLWCRNRRGEYGWVPAGNVQPTSPQT